MTPDPAKSRIAVAMLGARRHYAVPRILRAAGMLDCFFTDFCFSASGWSLPSRLVPTRYTASRSIPDIPADRIRHFPLFGLIRSLRNRCAFTPAARLRAYLAWNREFGRQVVDAGLGSADAVYAFNAAGAEILEHAKARSLRGILDQTAAPWPMEESVLAEERERWPGWEFEGATKADWEPLAERERREWQLADVIVCGSDYVRNGIQSIGGPSEKCAVVPYGISDTAFVPRIRERRDGPLRVLFVGTIQLRKGIQYLMEAVRFLRNQEFVLRAVGAIRVSVDATRQISKSIELAGPVPRSGLRNEYDWADVLVAPSISEGSANVCYEALASGLPIITTPSSGSVVRDGIEGFIVPIRNAQAIADKLNVLFSDHALISRLSTAAMKRSEDFTWQKYGGRLISAITRE